MSKDLSGFSILVMDYGAGISVAQRLARDFGTVFYWGGPYVTNAFPVHNPLVVGLNVPNIIKVKEWASVYLEADAVMFVDSMEPRLQSWMKSEGKPVFGCCSADRLEHDRLFIKQMLKDMGLPVGPYYVAHGLDQLSELLMSSKGGFVKSSLRGESETWRHRDWRLSKWKLKKLRHNMGLYENKETYVLEDILDPVAEFGYDGFLANGSYVDISMCGFEIKDKLYIGKFIYYNQLPEQIRTVNNALAPIFNEMGYNGHYSNEIIVTKDKRGFLLDNSNRFPSPPGDLMLEAYTNYSEIVWEIANGRMPYIEYKDPWGMQLIIKSQSAKQDEICPILVPDEYKQNVKIKNLSIDEEGTWHFAPSPGLDMAEIGSVVCTGSSFEDVVSKATKIVESIQGLDISIDIDAVSDVKKAMAKLNKAGISYI